MIFRQTDLLKNTEFGRLLRDCPLLCIDIGARGGFESDLLPIAFAVDAVGVEPDPEAFGALATSGSAPWRSLRYLRSAIAGSRGQRVLSVPRYGGSASLLEHDISFGSVFKKPQFFEVERREPVETETLDQALQGAGLSGPSYLKLDVEGAELEILEAAPQAVASLLAVKVEVSFLPFRKGQPLAADIDAFFRARGFQLMDLLTPVHWRSESDVVHPHADCGRVPYSRGQLAQGDYLYFRSPEALEGDEQRLKAAGLAAAYGFFDHALRLLGPCGIDAETVIGEASRVFGRHAWLEAAKTHLRRLWTFARSLRNLSGAMPSGRRQ